MGEGSGFVKCYAMVEMTRLLPKKCACTQSARLPQCRASVFQANVSSKLVRAWTP